jgi:hypothetical protein
MKFLRLIWRIVPVSIRKTLFKFRYSLADSYIIYKPTYRDDGLITDHIVDFMNEEKFKTAYGNGKKTGAIKSHPGDIHFRAYIACWAALHAQNIEGDFVECGVGKGLLSRTIVEYANFRELEKKLFLIDTYQGIPVEQGIEDEVDSMKLLNTLHFNSSYLEEVKNTFSEYDNVIIIPGRIPEILSDHNFGKVCYLSIDMNNSIAETSALEFFWDKLTPGAIILFDDYAYGEQFRAQKDAIDNFIELKGYSVLTLPTGQGMVIKR